MKVRRKLLAMMAVLCAGVFTACSDDNDSDPNPGLTSENSGYVIAASGFATDGNSPLYLLTSNELESGSLTTSGSGKEVETATAWVYNRNKYLYRLVYNQGNAGTGSSYILDENGDIKERNIAFNITKRFTSYGNYDKYVITASAAASTESDAENNYKYGVAFTVLDTEAQTKDESKFLITENLTGNGEYYTLSGIVEHNGKIYSGLCPVGVSAWGVANTSGAVKYPDLLSTSNTISGTQYPNEAYVIIFNGMDFSDYKILKDERISYPTGRRQSQYYNTIAAAEDGYVYVFSASDAKTSSNAVQLTDLNSGVIRINASTDEVDPNFYFDLETAAGGRRMLRAWHIAGTNDSFLVRMYNTTDPTASFNTVGANPNRLAIFKASTKSFAWVSGVPDIDNITASSLFPHFENGKVYMPIVANDGNLPTVYVIDPANASATKGLVVDASDVTAIGKLEIQK